MTDTSAEAVERLAKAMYESTIDEETCPKWPPRNPDDLQYWLTIAGVAHAAFSAENTALQEYAHEATKALTSLTVGGSEFFGKELAGFYTADLQCCVDHIEDRREAAHKRTLAATKKANELQSENAALQARVAELEAGVKEADHTLIDKYRDPKTGAFHFPDDVAAIIRKLEAQNAEAWDAAIEAAAVWVGEYHWNRYKTRAEGGLSSPAVFSSHTHQAVTEGIRAIPNPHKEKDDE